MGKITFKIIANPSLARMIEVTLDPNAMSGNLPVNPNTSIKWKATKADEEFRVFFFDVDSPHTAFWPFKEGQNGHPPDGHDLQGRPYLLVNQVEKSRKLKSNAPVGIKYDVIAVIPASGDPVPDVAALDPVIIIRTKNFLNIALGVTCAVLGAIVGALLVTWWT